MASLSFTVPGKPASVNRNGWNGRPFVKSPAARDFQNAVAAAGARARIRERFPCTDSSVEVRARIFFDSERPDTDGPVKLILDGLQPMRTKRPVRMGAGIIVNDRQVRRLIVDREIDRERPRVEITVTEIAP